jgi:hypothetical protein
MKVAGSTVFTAKVAMPERIFGKNRKVTEETTAAPVAETAP